MIRSVRQSFADGELAPELHMRSDLAAYQKGAARMVNMYPRRTGSALQRPGTQAVSPNTWIGADGTYKAFPFYYDNSRSFVMLLCVGNCKAFTVNPTFGVLAAAFVFAPAGWVAGDTPAMRSKQVGDTLFVSAPGRLPVRIIYQRVASADTWTVAAETIEGPPAYTVSAASFAATLSGWTEMSGDEVKTAYYALWTQDAIGLRTRLWEGKKVVVGKVWQAGASVRFHIASGSIPSGATGHTWILCKRHGGGYGEIASFEVTAANISAASDAGGVLMFEDDNIVPDTYSSTQTGIRTAADDAAGYAVIGFHQQRQVLTGNRSAPWSLWFSRLGNLYTWQANRPADDADPFKVTLPAMRSSAVRHLVSGRRLLLLTEDGVYAVHSGGEGFAARTCTAEKVNPTGAGAAEPLDTGSALLFVADDDATLMEMRYSFADDAHVAVDRSVLSRHLVGSSGIRSAAWQPYPDGVLWLLLGDGRLLSFTYLPEHEVYGWARHEIIHPDGQPYDIVDIIAPGSVTAPQAAGDETVSDVCLVCRRGAYWSLLRFSPEGKARTDRVDWLQRVTGAPSDGTSVPFAAGAVWRSIGTDGAAGPWHQETQTGAMLVVYPQTIEIGFPVRWSLETLRPEYPGQAAQGLRRRVVSATVRTLATGAYLAGEPGNILTEVAGDPSAEAAHDGKLAVRGGWDWDGRVRLEGRVPGRAEILGITTDIEYEGGR